MKTLHDRSAARRAILRQWMQEQERAPAWVARKIGYTREYIALVLSGRYAFTDRREKYYEAWFFSRPGGDGRRRITVDTYTEQRILLYTPNEPSLVFC
jgi:hypothetical protein